jgi:hypothetical protein
MLQEKLKFGAQPTFDRTGLGNASTIAQIFGSKRNRIATPEDRTFESEGEAIESGLRRTVESRDICDAESGSSGVPI